jgi:hypothetical protein
VPEGKPFNLGYQAAVAAGYVDFFGEQEYQKVLDLDVGWLEDKDGAIEEVTDERASTLVGYAPSYALTPKGRRLLWDVGGYTIDTQG